MARQSAEIPRRWNVFYVIPGCQSSQWLLGWGCVGKKGRRAVVFRFWSGELSFCCCLQRGLGGCSIWFDGDLYCDLPGPGVTIPEIPFLELLSSHQGFAAFEKGLDVSYVLSSLEDILTSWKMFIGTVFETEVQCTRWRLILILQPLLDVALELAGLSMTENLFQRSMAGRLPVWFLLWNYQKHLRPRLVDPSQFTSITMQNPLRPPNRCCTNDKKQCDTTTGLQTWSKMTIPWGCCKAEATTNHPKPAQHPEHRRQTTYTPNHPKATGSPVKKQDAVCLRPFQPPSHQAEALPLSFDALFGTHLSHLMCMSTATCFGFTQKRSACGPASRKEGKDVDLSLKGTQLVSTDQLKTCNEADMLDAEPEVKPHC